MNGLDDLVNRLRHVTGHTTRAQTYLQGQQLDEESSLILQQALRRHPALSWLPMSSADAKKSLLENIREALDCEDPTGSEAAAPMGGLLTWLNNIANELEEERLSCVLADSTSAMRSSQRTLLESLGIDELPLLSQNPSSLACPWNVSFVLLGGPLFSSSYAKGEVRVPNATASVLANLQLINSDCYATDAWADLLAELEEFPISSVRAVWLAALHYFPTSATLLRLYLLKEINELRDVPPVWRCSEESEAKTVVKNVVRILNTFYRHLSITFSVDAYEMFFDFIGEFVQPDNAALDALFRTCLRRDVGNLPRSTPIWRRYVSWRTTCFHDGARRRDWTKRMYHRILQLPLMGLEEVKEEYDVFIATAFRGRIAVDEKIEVEKKLTRAKADAMKIQDVLNQIETKLYLPAPLMTFDMQPGSISIDAQRSLDLWTAWIVLLDHVNRSHTSSVPGSDALQSSRCRFFYLMRACCFPHQIDSWADLIHYCLHNQPALSDMERQNSTVSAIQQMMLFANKEVGSTLYAAESYRVLGRRELASGVMKESLVRIRVELLRIVKDEATQADKLLGDARRLLEEITVITVNWMRMGGNVRDSLHVSLVARYVMHQVDFLSLTMALLRKFLRAHVICEPSSLLHPFNTLCLEWMQLEVIRNKGIDISFSILRQWKEHLVLIIKSAPGKGWCPAMCGVDDQFLRGCQLIAASDATRLPAVVELLQDVELHVDATDGDASTFKYLCAQLRHDWFMSSPNAGIATTDSRQKLLSAYAPPHRYDTVQFCSNLRSCAEESLVRSTAAQSAIIDSATSLSIASPSLPDAGHLSLTVDTYPEEALWGSGDAAAATPSAPSNTFTTFKRRRTDEDMAAALQSRQKSQAAQHVRRSYLCEATRVPTLAEYLANTEEGGAARSASHRLDGLEFLIRELPTLNQYSPKCSEKEDISLEWLLECLQTCERLSA